MIWLGLLDDNKVMFIFWGVALLEGHLEINWWNFRLLKPIQIYIGFIGRL